MVSYDIEKESLEIGLIGLGDMGQLYANRIVAAGWKKVNICDQPNQYEKFKELFKDCGMNVCRDGHAVSRRSDFIIYSVEAENIDRVVAEYGPSTKLGAIVAGQTSVKEPEIRAFEKHLPDDVHIVSCHSLHGPTVDSEGQPLVMIQHRASKEKFEIALRILSCMDSEVVKLSYKEHDRITADTQAVTHVAFLSMGTAWKTQRQFPWETPQYVGGIENVKVHMALRIYSNKWHVYAGLAIMNPSAKTQIQQYAQSVSDLFKLMIQEKEKEFKSRVKKAGEFVFGECSDSREPILLSDTLLDKYSLSIVPKDKRKPNSHLSLLAMVDCWYTLGINPYEHMVCQTPLFRLWTGITEYLFRNAEMLEEAIHSALYSKDIRADDMEFYSASKGWAECVNIGNMHAYQKRFEDTAKFFESRYSEEETSLLVCCYVVTKLEER
ncbi:18342_t:CDS:10 [Funneliformis geosporum]|uniref:Prephenate dehydrogenase [NADP(+)] n=1 Tax=Funneliformis geosporum TaxID=1117311 RepID=A0A9W4WKD7_9GLOM|nr:18342_t:CDS:10 [Funneliformis geosporum]CAI2168482.1 12505_t:CDS:10 [Funneliformis geosporum]